MFFSVIIPLFNRPQEIDELLYSLTKQTEKGFEVLVIEDGSQQDAAAVIAKYLTFLDIHYFVKPNEGQGFARNYGFERAKGDYFIIFDSDCLIPPDYFAHVKNRLMTDWLDAYGGPDAADASFTDVQKAISYAMTSPFTTGGIRGNRKHMGPYHPRSFNMGLSRRVYEKIGGFLLTRLGEDIEYSIRIQKAGFKTGLIPEAVVYHKRRTDFWKFYKQLHFFGRARINIYKHFPAELKLVHFFPAVFTVYLGIILLLFLVPLFLGSHFLFFSVLAAIPLFIFCGLLFFHAYFKTSSLKVALLGVWASVVQLSAYGMGFIQDFVKKVIFKRV
ncbi:Glycosyltransferase, GT2 family [bacterium A37T11]|nr:Glycosyltransferase, GT2 family [bacterium A37T11]